MEGIVAGLNEAQRSAVTSQASVLQVLAGPGSGKTKTLSARVAYLLCEKRYEPWQIIVCTFTVKAAKEMKERIASVLGTEVANHLILGTFHSISRRLLAKFGRHIGLDDKFGIADTSDSKSIIHRIIKQQKLTTDPHIALHRISSLKSRGISAELNTARTKNVAKKAVDAEHFAVVYSEYEQELRLANLLDYDDLLLRCVELLQNHAECVNRIEAVLIDEFQDTNETQYSLMRLFSQARSNITIVGDPDQSIYGWRNAKAENLDLMQQHYPDHQVVNLEENYRSSGCILMAADEIIQQDQSRHKKFLKPTHSLGMDPVLRELCNAKAESAWIVSEIQRTAALSGHLFRWSDYAILLRSAFLSRNIEIMLGKEGMPYRMIGGHRFYDRVEVKLLLDYLRVIDSPEHSEATARVINTPPRGVGEKTLQGLQDDASERKMTLWALILSLARGEIKPSKELSSQAQKGIERFVNLVLIVRKHLEKDDSASLADFLNFVIEKTKLRPYVEDKYAKDFEIRWENVQELVSQADEASNLLEEYGFDMDPTVDSSADNQVANLDDARAQISKTTPEARRELLRRFLANVTLTTDVQKKTNDKDDDNYITLSTMHAAKGLEWPVVFIPSAYQGSIPHSRSEDTDEERRLLYVAMTRAQALLYISYPTKGANREDLQLSHFLSNQNVKARTVSRGGRITGDDVQEAARILRRECPTRAVLDAGINSLEFLEDDQRPRFGFKLVYDPDNELHTNDELPLGYAGWMKARSLSRDPLKGPYREALVQSNVVTTMDQRSEFSESKASFTSFTTAKIVHEATGKENIQPIYPIPKRSISETSTDRPPTKRKNKGVQPVEGRSTLTNWFAKQPKALTRCEQPFKQL